MCGICGLLQTQQAVDTAPLQSMCRALHHRGPDEDGYLIDDNIGLAMRRLKIIDLATGSQPIYNETRDVGILFNGEIYNYPALREQLITQGHGFRSHSDTETIVHAYEQYGVDCLPMLNGMFAFALYDQPRRRVLLARDRTGQKPLFYHKKPSGDLVFASELKALLASGEVPRRINHTAIYHYLSLQYVPSPATILEDVYQLPPAHYALWENGTLTIAPYWQPAYEPKAQHTHDEWLTLTRQTVTDAVARHMLSDVPIGAYLSGGVDSSIVVALMSQQSRQPVKTFSIGFDVAAYSETDHARRIAERYGTEHHEFIISATQITDALEPVVIAADQPLADTSLMATYLLAQLTRQHVTVALTGDGGDEAFAGYTRYTLDKLLNYYRRVPAWVRLKAMPALANRLPVRTDIPTDRSYVAGVQRLAQASSTTHKASILAWGSFFTEAQKHTLANPEWLAHAADQPTADWLAEAYDRATASSVLDRTLAADFVTYLPDDLLVKADRMAMAHSLETRAPFLDNEVLALTMTMPESLKIQGRTQKAILRQAFADVLPSENVKRIKRGFGMPVASWLRGHLRDYAQAILLDERSRSRGYFEPGGIQHLLQAHISGQADHGQRIWALLVLELWHRHYIDP